MSLMSKRLSLSTALFLIFSFNTCPSGATDTISSGQSLFANQTIVSEGGMFELGFFTPGNSQNYYIGIWYKNIPHKTVIWVANRDKPISNINTSEFKISKDGNLLLTQSQTPLWSSNLTSPTTNPTAAVLRDSGNFVLREVINSSDVLWQSFDHPTDSWMPNQKLGLNKITGENQLILSWRNSEDPSSGLFSMGLDPKGTSQYFLWRNETEYWDSGLWDGSTFINIPGMETGNFLSYHHIQDNKQGNYFTYTPNNIAPISRIIVDSTGQSKVMQWLEESQEWQWVCLLPSDPCSVPSLCGGFGSCNGQTVPFCSCLQGFTPSSERDWNLSDWSSGCVRRTPLNCGNVNSLNGVKKDRFLMIPKLQLPINSHNLAVSVEECELACLNDCSCTAYSYSGLCSIWNVTLYDLKQLSDSSSSGGDSSVLYLRLAASEFPDTDIRRKKSSTVIIIGAAAAFVVLLITIAALFQKFCNNNLVKPLEGIDGTLRIFRYKNLSKMTNNFSEIIGGGGFGTVFKGSLPGSSTSIAVKKLDEHVQGEKQFRAEVTTLGQIRHVNLVPLRGFCSEGSERLLVYDYMPNGSLASHLFRNESKSLNWSTRYKIALGTARGLAYLHENCRDCIIHCDVKPENILLDEDFSPKVADFGMAKLVGRDFSRVLTTMRGTVGYLAPEWISGLAITRKTDVYSYGMMLLEIISGRRNAMQSEHEGFSFFPILAAKKVETDEIVSLLDYKLEGEGDIDEVRRACRVALWCIQDEESRRPTIGSVVQILEGVSEVNIPPTPVLLFTLVADQDSNYFSSE